ncbi:MAG TPA: TIGR00730 family Rossman fold protein, partial [Acinetobacter ursingii]|nr:TIGR00730 family Rossman fold protein [Acinetobacter ursingii]
MNSVVEMTADLNVTVKTTQPLIALYCGSRSGNKPIYREKAIELA